MWSPKKLRHEFARVLVQWHEVQNGELHDLSIDLNPAGFVCRVVFSRGRVKDMNPEVDSTEPQVLPSKGRGRPAGCRDSYQREKRSKLQVLHDRFQGLSKQTKKHLRVLLQPNCSTCGSCICATFEDTAQQSLTHETTQLFREHAVGILAPASL